MEVIFFYLSFPLIYFEAQLFAVFVKVYMWYIVKGYNVLLGNEISFYYLD